MIGTQHNPLLQGGGWLIESEPPEHKKDRAQAVAYTVRGLGRGPRRRDHLTPSERYALENDLWIAERVADRGDAAVLPGGTRPGLVRVAQLYLCSGGLLLDHLEDLGDVQTQAAIIWRYHRADRRVVANKRVITDERRDVLILRAGGAKAVEEAAEVLWSEAARGFMAYMENDKDGFPLLVGSGERRDWPAASDYAECLRLEGYGRREILERLNLEGWVNKHGRRRWNTHNYPVASA
jgi:hypothetical protein